MLRVGLTGELGSGKSTVAALLAAHGATVLSSDEMARSMMQPGEPVYQSIVDRFGPGILLPDRQINRPALATIAFSPQHSRVEELNAIIHPAVLAAQEQQIAGIAGEDPNAIVVVESALLLTTKHTIGSGESAEPWRRRFDQVVLVTAPDTVKIQRFVRRNANGRHLSPREELALRADAERRLAAQRIPAELSQDCLTIENAGDLASLQAKTAQLWTLLQNHRSA